jgi:hypothetical protein
MNVAMTGSSSEAMSSHDGTAFMPIPSGNGAISMPAWKPANAVRELIARNG